MLGNNLQATATAAIAVIAALIAFGQFWTARQKLALDLFEKRFALFLDVRLLVSEITQRGKLSNPGLPNEVLAKAKFLFGRDVEEEVDILVHLLIRREVGDQVTREVNDVLTRIEPIFQKYMRMDQKLPGKNWKWLATAQLFYQNRR